jgi:hypothetical protein
MAVIIIFFFILSLTIEVGGAGNDPCQNRATLIPRPLE